MGKLVIPTRQKPIRGTLLNRSHPLARGLIACLPMNEQSDLVRAAFGGQVGFDYSGHGSHLTSRNDEVAWIDALRNEGLELLTLAVGLTLREEPIPNTIFETTLSGGNYVDATIQGDYTLTVNMWYYDFDSEFFMPSSWFTSALPVGVPVHLAIVLNALTFEPYVYVNGVLDGTATYDPAAPPSTFIGYQAYVASTWGFRIIDDGVANALHYYHIYDHELPASMVRRLCREPWGMFEYGPPVYVFGGTVLPFVRPIGRGERVGECLGIQG